MKKIILSIATLGITFMTNAQDETVNGKLTVNGHIETIKNQYTVSYPSQTSRGDIFQLYKNVNNTLEIGVGGKSNTRRTWILSRHNDISGAYGKYYSTLHLQPDTGDKTQYRGIAIGYDASTHVSVGTHLAINGNVGIGTTNPDMKLTVKGNIHAEEVKIDLSVPAPDYVFKNDYNLRSLEEVEKYIVENSHLPEIPSAKEFEQNGVMQAEMDMNLLKKIEELTLYTISQEKKLKSQHSKLEKQKEQLNSVNKMLFELQSRLEKLESKK